MLARSSLPLLHKPARVIQHVCIVVAGSHGAVCIVFISKMLAFSIQPRVCAFCASAECEHPVGLVVFSRIVWQPAAMVETHYAALHSLSSRFIAFPLHKDELRGCCSAQSFVFSVFFFFFH